MSLNSNKTSKLRFFVLIFAVFLPDFIFFCTTVAQSSKFHANCGCFWSLHPTKTRTFTVRLAVTTKYQENGFAAEVLLGCESATTQVTQDSKSRPNRSHRKRSYSISNIGNMMGCDHQSCVTVGPFAGELWHFEYFPTTTVRQLLTFDHDCHCCPNLLLYTKFHQNWFTRSASRRPWLHNVQCAVARQRPLPWQPNHGGHVGDMMGCDHPSWSQSVHW